MKMPVMKVPALLLLLVMLLVVKADDAANVKKNDWIKPNQQKISALSFNVSLPADRYRSFMSSMDRQLALTTTKPHIEKRPVLGVQKSVPDNWLHVTLKGPVGHGECKIAIRADTLYLVGFQTTQGSWYAFKNRNHLIQGSTALTFIDDYKSLTGGKTYKDLVNVVVGKNSAEEALGILAKYKQGTTTDQETKKALLRFVLMFSEAARFQLIRADVSAAWDQEQGGQLRQVGVDLTVKWSDISCALLVSSTKKKWASIEEAQDIKDLGEPKMRSAQAAAENVYCILQATRCSAPY